MSPEMQKREELDKALGVIVEAAVEVTTSMSVKFGGPWKPTRADVIKYAYWLIDYEICKRIEPGVLKEPKGEKSGKASRT